MALSDKVQHVNFGLSPRSDGDSACRLLLDGEHKILSASAGCPDVIGLGENQLLGRTTRQVFDLSHLQALLANRFCFRGQPLRIGRRRLLCDFLPHETSEKLGGELSFRPGDSSGPDLQEVRVSVDPYLDLERDGILLVDREGAVVLVNQPLAALLGVPAGQLLGRSVAELAAAGPLCGLESTLRSRRSEVSEPRMMNGREVIVCRWPVEKDRTLVGAIGKVLFRPTVEEVSPAERIQPQKEPKSPPPPPSVPSGQAFKYDANSIIGHSRVMRELKEKLLRVADRGSSVLLLGESGTGKELFAHAIHAGSKRRHGPFIRVNCAAIPDHLLESELFGYVEGAFTGAKKGGQVGKFEQAHDGTIFLDEISDMPIPMQAKLLRVLQEKEVTPLGGTGTRRINMRVIAATNVDLQQRVEAGEFRTDLYYRLNVVALTIPPLRERAEDIFFIAKHMIDDFNAEFGMRIEGLEREAWEALQRYPFPGNIRELRNAIESAFNVAMDELIKLGDLPRHISQSQGSLPQAGGDQLQKSDLAASLGRKPLQEIVEELEKYLIEQTLKQAGGSKLAAANLLGISRPGLYKKLQKYDLQ